MPLTARQKHQLRPLHLNLKDSHIEQVHEPHLALLLMMNLAGDHGSHYWHMSNNIKKKSVSVVTAQTLCGHS